MAVRGPRRGRAARNPDPDVALNRPGGVCWHCEAPVQYKGRGTIACHHIFCYPCISRYWLETKDNKCPVCEEPFDEITGEQPQPPPRPEQAGKVDSKLVQRSWIMRQVTTFHNPQLNTKLRVNCGNGTVTLFGLEDAARPPGPRLCGICRKDSDGVRHGLLPPCDHFFCFDCIIPWALVQPSCPLCFEGFHQIYSFYPNTLPYTRGRHAFQDVAFDLPYRQFVTSTEFLNRQRSKYVARLQCELCDEINSTYESDSNWLRDCNNCGRNVHDNCAAPVFKNGTWKCVLCTPPVNNN